MASRRDLADLLKALATLCGVVLTITVFCLVVMYDARKDRREQTRSTPSMPRESPAVERATTRLTYLSELPEVDWFRVDGNNVYIGAREPPQRSDVEVIVRAAALHGHRAYGGGFHAWAVCAELRGFDPWSDPWYAEATARGGKVTDCTVH